MRRSYSNTKRGIFGISNLKYSCKVPHPCCIIVIRLDDGQSFVAETCSLLLAECTGGLTDEKFIYMKQNLLRICQNLGHVQINYSQCICNVFVTFAKHDQLL
jgi:hypothetical protein